MKLSPRIAGAVASLWALGVGATSAIAMPWWGHYAVCAGGIVLAGLGLIPSADVPPAPKSPPSPWS